MNDRLRVVNQYIITAWLFLLIVAAFVLAACPFKKDSMPDIIKAAAKFPPGAVPTSSEVQQMSPDGLRHHGYKPMTDVQLALADQGVTELNKSAIEDGFRPEANKPHGGFLISTPPLPCTPSPASRTPSFVVNGGVFYDGTIYDQYNTKGKYPTPVRRESDGEMLYFKPDGVSVIFAPEMVLGFGNDPPRDAFVWLYVCPDNSVIANAVKHGGEHAFLATFPYTEKHRERGPYDGYAWFNATVYHGPGHPLLPRPASALETDFVDKPVETEFREVESGVETDALAKEAGVTDVKWRTGLFRPVQ